MEMERWRKKRRPTKVMRAAAIHCSLLGRRPTVSQEQTSMRFHLLAFDESNALMASNWKLLCKWLFACVSSANSPSAVSSLNVPVMIMDIWMPWRMGKATSPWRRWEIRHCGCIDKQMTQMTHMSKHVEAISKTGARKGEEHVLMYLRSLGIIHCARTAWFRVTRYKFKGLEIETLMFKQFLSHRHVRTQQIQPLNVHPSGSSCSFPAANFVKGKTGRACSKYACRGQTEQLLGKIFRTPLKDVSKNELN